MSLDWNMTAVRESGALTRDEHENAVTTALIYATMTCGIPQITENSAPEFFERVHMLETLHGAFLYKLDGREVLQPYHVTLADVRRRIGLHTNATTLTRAGFIRIQVANLNHAAMRERQRQEQEAGRNPILNALVAASEPMEARRVSPFPSHMKNAVETYASDAAPGL